MDVRVVVCVGSESATSSPQYLVAARSKVDVDDAIVVTLSPCLVSAHTLRI